MKVNEKVTLGSWDGITTLDSILHFVLFEETTDNSVVRYHIGFISLPDHRAKNLESLEAPPVVAQPFEDDAVGKDVGRAPQVGHHEPHDVQGLLHSPLVA
jgi:hypothetical protein